MYGIEFATVLPGATGFRAGNVNDTYRGQVLLADGTVKAAILKDLDAVQLANELFASVLGKLLGLPVPNSYLALVRGADLLVSKAPSLQDGNRAVFASTDVKVPNITFRFSAASQAEQLLMMQDILSWQFLGHLYAFDSWIANIDRHPGNLLFGGKDEIWLIDHGHSFTGPNWSPTDLSCAGAFRNRLREWLTRYLNGGQRQARCKEAGEFMNAAGRIDVFQASSGSHIELILPLEAVVAVRKFISDRIPHILHHASGALESPVMV